MAGRIDDDYPLVTLEEIDQGYTQADVDEILAWKRKMKRDNEKRHS